MTKHFQYLKYVLKHKYYVFVEGRKLGLGIWQLLIHDWQKFTPTEWSPYVMTFYGGWKYGDRPQWLKDAFNRAWLHHIHHGGQHHWQHWLLMYDDDKEQYERIEMPDRYRREMLADWRGAGRAITGQDNTDKWYLERRERFKNVLHPNTRQWIEEQLGMKEAGRLLLDGKEWNQAS